MINSASHVGIERTEAGEQMLVAGVRPVTVREKIEAMALRPMAPRRNPYARQRPCNVGLFDEDQKAQIDLADLL